MNGVYHCLYGILTSVFLVISIMKIMQPGAIRLTSNWPECDLLHANILK